MKIPPTQFEGQDIRRVYAEATETRCISVEDVVQVLTQQADDLTARKYWNQPKQQLDKKATNW
jgi:DNA-damage-inducible protein D